MYSVLLWNSWAWVDTMFVYKTGCLAFLKESKKDMTKLQEANLALKMSDDLESRMRNADVEQHSRQTNIEMNRIKISRSSPPSRNRPNGQMLHHTVNQINCAISKDFNLRIYY